MWESIKSIPKWFWWTLAAIAALTVASIMICDHQKKQTDGKTKGTIDSIPPAETEPTDVFDLYMRATGL